MVKRTSHPPVVPAVAKRVRSPEPPPSPPPLSHAGASSRKVVGPVLTASVLATAKVSGVKPVGAATVAVRVLRAESPNDDVAGLRESSPTHSRSVSEGAVEEEGSASTSIDGDGSRCERQLKSRSSPMHRAEWMAKFELLKKFIQQHKHARVPTKLHTDEYPKLGQWVSVQRTAKRLEDKRQAGEQVKGKNRISHEQVALLQSVGFLWGATVTARNLKAWDAKFRLLQQYHEANGHTRVPKALDSEEFPQLGHWVQRQRSAYANEQRIKEGKPLDKSNRKRITAEHIAKLETLGFQWSIRSRHGSPRSSSQPPSHKHSPKSQSSAHSESSPAFDIAGGKFSLPLASSASPAETLSSPAARAAPAVISRLKGGAAAALTVDEGSDDDARQSAEPHHQHRLDLQNGSMMPQTSAQEENPTSGGATRRRRRRTGGRRRRLPGQKER